MLELKNITLRFGGLTAVDDVSFTVQKGEVFSLIGPNGAGKTSVFNSISGVYEPTAGEMRFEGEEMYERLSFKALLGFVVTGLVTAVGLMLSLHLQDYWQAILVDNYVFMEPFNWTQGIHSGFQFLFALPLFATVGAFFLGGGVGVAGAVQVWQMSRRTPDYVAHLGIARTFQNIRLFQGMTVMENVLVGMDSRLRTRFWHAALRLPLFWREARSSEEESLKILQFVGLDSFAHRQASALSYGDQRRLEIARALASRPKLLLLDEPAAGMNPTETGDLMALIRKICENGVTILLIEHHMQVVMNISDRIAVLDSGKKIAEGTPAEVRSNPLVIKAYLGTA